MKQELIWELMKQAGELAYEEHKAKCLEEGLDPERTVWSVTGATYEKFAELLIRECCIALNPMLRDMISRGQGVDMIKLHFGMNPKEITTRMLDTAIAQCEQELAKKKSGVEQ